MTGDSENIACRERDRQNGLHSLNHGYLEAYLHGLAHLSSGDIERKMLQMGRFRRGGHQGGPGAHPHGLSPMQNEEFVGWSLLFGMSREIPLSDQHHAPSPQEKFYGIRWRHNTAILVMEFTIEPQDLLITPTRSRSNDRYTLPEQEEYHARTNNKSPHRFFPHSRISCPITTHTPGFRTERSPFSHEQGDNHAP